MHKSTQDVLYGMLVVLMLVLPLCFIFSPFWMLAAYVTGCLFCVLILILRAVDRLSIDVQEPQQQAHAAVPEDPAVAGPQAAAEPVRR